MGRPWYIHGLKGDNMIEKIDKYLTEGGRVNPMLDELDATSKKLLKISKKLLTNKYDGAKKLMKISLDVQRVYDDLYNKYYEK